MKSKKLLTALTAISLTFSGLALAQGGPGPDRNDRNDRGGPGQQDRRGPPDARRAPPRPMPQQMHQGERGAGPDHNFYRGGRLPTEYRNRGYVVNDWRGHRLSAPPRGYQWVQTGGDYVLVAIATGLIAQVLLGQ